MAHGWLRCGIALATLAAATPAAADADVILGAGAGVRPDYPGSDDYAAEALPTLRLNWSGEAAKAPEQGYKTSFGVVDASLGFPHGVEFGVARISTPDRHFTLRLGAGLRPGRDADDNRALHGMGDIDRQPVLRLKLESEPAAKYGVGGFFGIGWESDLSSETRGDTVTLYGGNVFALSDSAILTLTAHASWYDDAYTGAYFGISPAQAAASGRPRFDAGSGLGDTGLEARIRWAFTDNWSVFGSVGVVRLIGDAADGPLVDDAGNATQFRAGTGIAYRF